jgi:hypothetical protein
MGCALLKCLGDYVPSSPRYPSPPYRGSSSAAPTEIAPIEEGDSRGSVEEVLINIINDRQWSVSMTSAGERLSWRV